MKSQKYLSVFFGFLFLLFYPPVASPTSVAADQQNAKAKVVVSTLEQATKETQVAEEPPAYSEEETALITTFFCDGDICPEGNWQQWVIYDPENPWSARELVQIQQALSQTFAALAEFDIDGPELLAGYRVRRQHGEYHHGAGRH